jgi:nitrogen fixation protein FixH
MSDATVNQAKRRGLRGHHVLTVFLGFFATVFIVDGFMIYQAVSTFGGLETQDAYRKGLAYNERIAAGAEQERRGWDDALSFLPDREKVRVVLSDSAGVPVSGLAVNGSIGRAATDRFDRGLTFAQTGPGTYEADASNLQPGWWTVDVEAVSAVPGDQSNVYTSRRRLWIKP